MIRKGGHLEKETGFMMIDNVPEGKCKVCATGHSEDQPHNQQSIHYQYKFYDENGRWPTWNDAMKHCSDDVKKYWSNALKSKDIDIGV
ncbi:hypothetical protein [Sporosarcina sp. FSL K6-2383]|uniref:hypothetical protein n=1 Tax=Sporosarcina sp. FSL K6-2383 TaxID=2921556 RepID=UPI00315A7A4E